MSVPTWCRALLVAVAIPQGLAGAWAVIAPKDWYESFPGFDPRLVIAEPPFNEHLASDAGAGLLASAVVLLLAAAWPERRIAIVACISYLVFSFPHALYHTLNPAPGLTGPEDVRNTLVLWIGVVAVAVVLAAAARLREPARPLEDIPA